MGASVGVGALIVGASLLTIFALASAAIDLQVDEALERIEESGDNSVPSFTVDDASNDVDGVAEVTITAPGTGYQVDDIISSGSVDSLSFVSGGTGYSDSTNLDWDTGGVCATDPAGTYTVSTEVFSFTAVADVGNSLGGTYFEYSSPSTDYYVWFRVSGNGFNPNLAGKTSVLVTLTTNDDAGTVATRTATEIATSGAASQSGTNPRTITLDDAGAATDAADFDSGFTIDIDTDGGEMLSATLTDGGNGCTGTPTVDGADGSSSSLTLVMSSSFGFSAKVKTVSTGGITSIEMISAGQGHTSAPNIFAARGTGATFTVVLDNVLTWNMTNNGQEVLKFTHIWFALDGGEPEQLSTSTYTIWDFPKHDYLFPGETVMVSYDLNSATPSIIAASCMGGQSSKAVTQNG
jgi:archaellum component FlaF (FlaF/FlaG flagellin family)